MGICVYVMVLMEFVHDDRGVSFRFEVDLTVIKEQCYKCSLGQNEHAVLVLTTFNTLINPSGQVLSQTFMKMNRQIDKVYKTRRIQTIK